MGETWISIWCGLFVVVVLCGFAWALSNAPTSEDIAKEADPLFPALNEHYSEIAGYPVSFEYNGQFECIVDIDDGTLQIGVGHSPHEAFMDATQSEPFVGFQ